MKEYGAWGWEADDMDYDWEPEDPDYNSEFVDPFWDDFEEDDDSI
jgi:hypothetical protein